MCRCSRCIEGSGREGFGLYARCAQAVCFIELWNERRDDSSKYVYVDISQSLSRMQSATSASEVRLQVRVYSVFYADGAPCFESISDQVVVVPTILPGTRLWSVRHARCLVGGFAEIVRLVCLSIAVRFSTVSIEDRRCWRCRASTSKKFERVEQMIICPNTKWRILQEMRVLSIMHSRVKHLRFHSSRTFKQSLSLTNFHGQGSRVHKDVGPGDHGGGAVGGIVSAIHDGFGVGGAG